MESAHILTTSPCSYLSLLSPISNISTVSCSRGVHIRSLPVFKPAGITTANRDAELYAPYSTSPTPPPPPSTRTSNPTPTSPPPPTHTHTYPHTPPHTSGPELIVVGGVGRWGWIELDTGRVGGM